MSYTLHHDCKTCDVVLSTLLEKISGFCKKCRDEMMKDSHAMPESG